MHSAFLHTLKCSCSLVQYIPLPPTLYPLANSFLKKVLLQATTLSSCSQGEEGQVLESCIASLSRVASLEPSLSSCALYSTTLLQCRQLLHQVSCTDRQTDRLFVCLLQVQSQLCQSVAVVSSPAAIASDLQEVTTLVYPLLSPPLPPLCSC